MVSKASGLLLRFLLRVLLIDDVLVVRSRHPVPAPPADTERHRQHETGEGEVHGKNVRLPDGGGTDCRWLHPFVALGCSIHRPMSTSCACP